MAQTTSDLLVERLIDWGVDTVFGLPGDDINGFFEALRQAQDRVRFVHVRHQEEAAFAACGYAKFTGRLGVCCSTAGPGAVHVLDGLDDAKVDRASVLVPTLGIGVGETGRHVAGRCSGPGGSTRPHAAR